MGLMKTTPEIIAALREQLGREPTKDEIDAERSRLMKAWYADMALSASTLANEGNDQ